MGVGEKILNGLIGLSLLGIIACLLAIFVPSFNKSLNPGDLAVALIVLFVTNNAVWWIKIVTSNS
jgi:hypothetical protein